MMKTTLLLLRWTILLSFCMDRGCLSQMENAANILQWFTFNTNAEFRCPEPGYRCGIGIRNQYSTVNDGGGSLQVVPGGAEIWFPSEAGFDDVLKLQGCITPPCVVYCFQNCTCTDTSTSSSCALTTAAPNSAPTPAPAAKECPLINNTQECPALMENAVPAGTLCSPCYNFCNGTFQSCCTAATGNCGPVSCEGGTSVLGCTLDDIGKGTGSPNGGGASGASSLTAQPRTILLSFTTVGSLLFMVWIM